MDGFACRLDRGVYRVSSIVMAERDAMRLKKEKKNKRKEKRIKVSERLDFRKDWRI